MALVGLCKLHRLGRADEMFLALDEIEPEALKMLTLYAVGELERLDYVAYVETNKVSHG